MNQKDTSIPTVSLSMRVHSGWRQSSKAVSHNRSCGACPAADRTTKAATTNAGAMNFILIGSEKKCGGIKSSESLRVPKYCVRNLCEMCASLTLGFWRQDTMRDRNGSHRRMQFS